MSFLVGYALGLLGLTPAQAVTIAETAAIQNSAGSTVAEALENPDVQTVVATAVVNNATPSSSSSSSSSSASSTPEGMTRIQQIKAQLAEAAKGGPVKKTVVNSVNVGLVAQRKESTAAELSAAANPTKKPLKLTGIMLPPSLLYHPATISMPGSNHSSSGSIQAVALAEMQVKLNGLEDELTELQSMNKTPNIENRISKITGHIKGIKSVLGKKGGKRKKQTRRKYRKSHKTHHH